MLEDSIVVVVEEVTVGETVGEVTDMVMVHHEEEVVLTSKLLIL